MKETDKKLTDAMTNTMHVINDITMDQEFGGKKIVWGAVSNGVSSNSGRLLRQH